MRRGLVGIVVVAACGGPAPSAHFTVQALSAESADGRPASSLTMHSGEVKILQLLIVGTVPGPVTVEMKGAPDFATLSGQLLTLSPTRADQGEYQITLVAESGGQKASTALAVSVTRPDSAPSPVHVFFGDDGLHDSATCPGPQWCTAVGPPTIGVNTDDPDGDDITVDLEVVRRGEPFSRTPTYSQTVPAATASRQSVLFTLEGLLPGQPYSFAVRACDQFGMCASPREAITGRGGSDDQGVALADGWVTAPRLGFDQGPCPAGAQCACKPSGMFSFFKDDCCSRAVVFNPPTPTFPNGEWVCQ